MNVLLNDYESWKRVKDGIHQGLEYSSVPYKDKGMKCLLSKFV